MKRAALGLLFACAYAGAQNAALLVSHKGASTLGFYTAEGKLVDSAAVGLHPHEMVMSADGRFVYTSDNGTMRIEEPGEGGNTVSIVDIAGRRKVGEISLGRFRRPHGLALDRKTGRLAVTTELPDALLIVDPVRREVVRAYDTNGRTSHMVTLSADGTVAFVSNSGSGNVAAIELATGAVKLIPTGERPEGSALSPDGRFVYIANREARSVAIIDVAKRELAGRIATGNGPVRIAVTPDGRHVVYAAMHDRAVEIADTAARKVVGRVPLEAGSPLVSLDLSRDGKLAYTSAEESGTVYVVDLAARKLVRKFRTAAGAHPDPVMEIPAAE